MKDSANANLKVERTERASMPMNLRLILILLIIEIATLFVSCSNAPDHAKNKEIADPTIQETEPATVEPSNEPITEASSEPATEASEEPSTAVVYTTDDLADFTITTLDSINTGNLIYSVENTETSVMINFSMQGIDSVASTVTLDYGTYADDWQTIISSVLSYEVYESLRLVADAWELSDVAIVQNLVSEDGSITYASAVNGEITTDIVTELASSLDASERG